MTVKIPATELNPHNPAREIGITYKIQGGKLKAKYDIEKKERKQLFHLPEIKAKKVSPLRERLFLGTFAVGTLVSSYLTQSQAPSDKVTTESQGEGVITSLLNGTLTTSSKQVGKKSTKWRLFGGLGSTLVVVNTAENVLLHFGLLPFRFAGAVNSIGLGIISKISKNWIYGKAYFKTSKPTAGTP